MFRQRNDNGRAFLARQTWWQLHITEAKTGDAGFFADRSQHVFVVRGPGFGPDLGDRDAVIASCFADHGGESRITRKSGVATFLLPLLPLTRQYKARHGESQDPLGDGPTRLAGIQVPDTRNGITGRTRHRLGSLAVRRHGADPCGLTGGQQMAQPERGDSSPLGQGGGQCVRWYGRHHLDLSRAIPAHWRAVAQWPPSLVQADPHDALARRRDDVIVLQS